MADRRIIMYLIPKKRALQLNKHVCWCVRSGLHEEKPFPPVRHLELLLVFCSNSCSNPQARTGLAMLNYSAMRGAARSRLYPSPDYFEFIQKKNLSHRRKWERSLPANLENYPVRWILIQNTASNRRQGHRLF